MVVDGYGGSSAVPGQTEPYPIRRNHLRELLESGMPSLGTHLLSTWPTLTELVGQTGHYDYIEFVLEYAPWTMHDLDNLGRTIEIFPDFTGMVKIEQDARGHLAMRAIGSGLQNVLFADIRTPDDALRCVRSVRAEHPNYHGLHGVGMRRDARFGSHAGSEAWIRSLADSVVAIMIEKKEAVERLDEILAVEGIDMVQFGPADYAMSMGLSRRADAERVAETEAYVISAALERGIQPRAEIRDVDSADRYLAMGVRHFCIGHEVHILRDWWSQKGAEMRTLLGRSEIDTRPTSFTA
jgi:2-keto-3-deoxy-L-rhamnonate aldolase RhmA